MNIMKTEIAKSWIKLPLYMKGAWIGTMPIYIWLIYLAYYMIKINVLNVPLTYEVGTKLMSLIVIVPPVLLGVIASGAFSGYIVSRITDK